MSKKNYTEYKWEENLGYAECLIHYNGQVFEGTALCVDEDKPYQSRAIGEQLASSRATRYYLAWVRDTEVLPQLKALNQLYYSMKHSGQFNSKSYEAKMLFRQIRQKELDLEAIRQAIKDLRQTESSVILGIERIKKYHNNKPE
jgi:hypothetical protein